MTQYLTSEQERMHDKDVCSRCERVISVDGVHTCGPRNDLLHKRHDYAGHTRLFKDGRLVVRPVASVLAEDTEERRSARREAQRKLEAEEQERFGPRVWMYEMYP